MGSKRTVKSVKASCDRLWALLIKLRAGSSCERCGRSGRLEAHHIYGRTDHRLRWDPRNGTSLCTQCHRDAGRYPDEFLSWLSGERITDRTYLRLQRQKGPIRRTMGDYLVLEAWLREQLAEWTEEAA